jgi:RNAse (barnase) inhibitor barstar
VPGAVVTIDGSRITSAATFHGAFADAFGFPSWYGRNWDAWIDLMSCLDEDRSTALWVEAGETVTILLENAKLFREQAKEAYDALIKYSAFVNWRRLEAGDSAYLCVAFDD